MRLLLRKTRARLLGSGVARDVCAGAASGRAPRRALMLYRAAPFLHPDQPVVHQNMGQSRELARAIAERGYAVDVVDFDERRRSLLTSNYDLVIDLHPRRDPLYAERLVPGAVRVAYITGCDPAFGNAAERSRLDALAARRGVRLRARREVPPFEKDVIESYDATMIFGSRFTLGTYRGYALPSVHTLPNNGYEDAPLPDPSRRDPRRFLYLASSGQVHKGLDLLLETFAARPDLSLVVCGPFRKEVDFARHYRRELFHASNIEAVGFVDVRSPAFAEIQASCGAMILPSCAEAQCGTVTVSMSLGLPPIVSEACGFDEPDLETLKDCALDTIAATVEAWAARPRAWIAERSRAALAIARTRYRPAHYAAAVRGALDAILAQAAAR